MSPLLAGLLLLAPLARAEDPPPADLAPTASTPPPLTAHVAGEEIDVRAEQEVLRRRAELFQALRDEGYVRQIRKEDRTILLSEDPWKPRVVVHDDGWVYFTRQPPRIHAPGRSFADQGTPAAYLLCLIAPTACVSVGGWMVSDKKLGHVKAEVVDSTHDEVRAMNDAVARRELGRRVNEDIPKDLEKIWSTGDLSVDQRHTLLLEYWDTRTDTPEGREAQEAIASFLRGVVQRSESPISPEELATFNAHRQSIEPLVLDRSAEP